MGGSCEALIVANDEYTHDDLRRLLGPRHDADALADALGDPGLGAMPFSLEIGNCFRIAAHQIWWTGSVYAVSVHLTRAIQ
jgi:hypothetical protein